MASNLPACSAGMMPSQSCVTNVALDLHFVAERLGDVDVEADELAVGGQVVEGRVGAFGADLQDFSWAWAAPSDKRSGGRSAKRDTQCNYA